MPVTTVPAKETNEICRNIQSLFPTKDEKRKNIHQGDDKLLLQADKSNSNNKRRFRQALPNLYLNSGMP